MKLVASLSVAVLAAVACTLAWADHHEEANKPAWFDAENCTICQCMGENKELMMNVKWETHVIDNGMLMMSVVPEEYMDDMDKCCTEMKAIAQQVMSGEKEGQMCGFCNAFGELMQAGANEEQLDTAVGKITLLTSDNPETVKKIHKVAKRTQEEAKKMEEQMKKLQTSAG